MGWFISTSGRDLSHVFILHSSQIFAAAFCRLLNCCERTFTRFCWLLDGSPVKKLAAVWRWEVRGAFFHLHYCASHPSAPPSALHPTPLCHFCSLISFTSAFSAGFLWNPTANDGGLSRTTQLRPHYLSSTLSLFLPHPLFMTIHLPLSSLSRALTSVFCVWVEERGVFGPSGLQFVHHRTIQSGNPRFWLVFMTAPPQKTPQPVREKPPLSYHWSVHRHSLPLRMCYVIVRMW